MAVVVAVDVAVVGGGLQGLVVLRELVSAGYGCVLITNADLGAGQTLHSHGLLNSGTGLVAGALQEELYRFTLPYLRAIGVPVHGEDRSFLLAPDALVDQLTPVWEANHYRPERADPASLPVGFEPVAPVYRVQGFNVEKRRLVAALSAGLEPHVLGGEVVEAGDNIRVRAKGSGETLSLAPRAVVVAAGCGTKRLLRRAFGVNDVVLDRIAYRQTHMICVRGPAGVLPEVGAVVATEVMIVGHPSPDGLVTWYVTPAVPSPEHDGEAPDDGAAEVDVHVVKQGIDALLRLVPSLSHADERIQATVFAGYKQDFDGQPTRRACEVVDEDRNVVMALPSVLTNAVPNARDALTLIGDRLGAGTTKLELRREAAVVVGQVNEDTGRAAWRTWRDFAGVYDVAVG